jgi:hypothetical protein
METPTGSLRTTASGHHSDARWTAKKVATVAPIASGALTASKAATAAST